MDIKNLAEEFLSQDRIAVVGVSRSSGTGNAILKALHARGHDVVAINPNAETIDGAICYPSVQAVPGGVDGVVIVTQPAVAEAVARDCVEAGVSHVWMHYNALFGSGNSSVSTEATTYLRQNGVRVIPGGCPLMFGEQADVVHKCMRWLLDKTGKLPSAQAG